MADVREPAGPAFKIFTILGILFFLALVAGLITTYDSGSDVETVAPAVTTPAPAPAASAQATGEAPVGAVATGGGGMAGAGGGIAMPVFVGLVALTMVAVSGFVVRRQAA